MTRPVLCLGAGRMGRGIAHATAYAGVPTRILDAKPRTAEAFARLREETLAEVRGSLALMAGLGGFEEDRIEAIMARVTVLPADGAAEAFAGASLVFEAVPETMAAKRDAFALFDRHADADAILASTTSTILSTDLAALTVRPANALNAHWLNPAYLIPLVEVSPNDQTTEDALARTEAFLDDLGKVPVRCKASPGYIVPRIQALAMNEAARLVEEGVASAEDVDRAVKYGFGLRFGILGLLEFIDWGGGDILFHASRQLSEAFGDPRFAAPRVVADNMAAGRIGMKTGQGFFDYSGIDIDAYRRERLGGFLAALRGAGLARPPAD